MKIHTKAVATSKESKRSKKPPWPGMILPLSLIFAIRFNLLSNRSPAVPNTAQIAAIDAQSFHFNVWLPEISGPNNAILTTQSMTPPNVPSHVFFGDIFEKGVFPIIDPTRYAMVSFIQSEKIMAQGNNEE